MNRSIVIVPAALLVAAAAAAAQPQCSIHPPKGASKAELAQLAKVSRADAEHAAKATFKDQSAVTAAEAELEAEHGCLIWSFDMKVKGVEGVQEVQVDAGNAKVLSSEHEGPAREADEQRGEHNKPHEQRH